MHIYSNQKDDLENAVSSAMQHFCKTVIENVDNGDCTFNDIKLKGWSIIAEYFGLTINAGFRPVEKDEK